MPPPSTNEFEITNYDVLADEITNPISSNESDIGLSLAAHSYHVGNNRLEVLCNIHNQAFSDHQAKNDEANSAAIVDKIMDIVQNQCVPKGRFLERNKKGEWKVVEKEKARSLIRQALSNVQHQNSSSAGQSELELKQKQEADAEKKRRRRSSLLRRSVSSSMLPNLVQAGGKPFDDKKKSSRKALSPAQSPSNSRSTSPVPPEKPEQAQPNRPMFGRSRSVELGGGRRARRLATKFDRPPIIKETLKMDILFNTAKTALIPGTDLHGNNRLRVMVNIQTGVYQNANEEEQSKMATDLVNTIENFWGGRILCQLPGFRGGKDKEEADEDQYVKLEDEHAVQAMRNLLSGKAAENEDMVTMGSDPEINIKQGRRASLKAIQSIAATDEESASILPSTLPKLPADMQHLRSAAVKSLQKRKQRQGLNSRIRGLTADKAAIFQDGSTNAAGSNEPIPTTITSTPPNVPLASNIQQYRQTSSGASVASTASNTTPVQPPPLGIRQRQGSISNASAASSNTSMSLNTMNAARTMANINLNANHPNQNPMMATNNNNPLMMQGGGPVLGSELQIPANIVTQNTMPQYQQRISIAMPIVPEEPSQDINAAAYNQQQQQTFTAEQLAQLNQAFGSGPNDFQNGMNMNMNFNTMNPQQMGGGRAVLDRNSLLNSTGSDGLPRFGQGEMELLIKGLEMAENQNQQQQHE